MEKSDMMIQLIGSLSGIKTIPHISTTPTLIHTSFISRTPQFSTSGPTNNTLNLHTHPAIFSEEAKNQTAVILSNEEFLLISFCYHLNRDHSR